MSKRVEQGSSAFGPRYQELLNAPSFMERQRRGVSRLQQKLLFDYLQATNWNVKQACRLAKMDRANFYRLLRLYQISRATHMEKKA